MAGWSFVRDTNWLISQNQNAANKGNIFRRALHGLSGLFK